MSLRESYDPNNIFAKIIRGEAPCVKVHEDSDTLSFMDIFPQSEGHCLVIPKNEKATNLFDIDDRALATLTLGARKVARAALKSLAPDGVRLVQFNGAAAGQTVYHIHFHVIPIYEGRGEARHASGTKADPAALEALARRIRAAL